MVAPLQVGGGITFEGGISVGNEPVGTLYTFNNTNDWIIGRALTNAIQFTGPHSVLFETIMPSLPIGQVITLNTAGGTYQATIQAQFVYTGATMGCVGIIYSPTLPGLQIIQSLTVLVV